MKKTLLTAALAVCAFASASAQVFDNFPEHLFHVMSNDGVYVAEANGGEIEVRNRLTNAKYYIHHVNEDDPVCTTGSSHCLSQNGTLVGFDGSDPCYWNKFGLKFTLPTLPQCGSDAGCANGISDNDEYIVGALPTAAGFNYDGLMNFPVIWTKQANGTYQAEELPHPTQDFSGREPQYVLLNDVSNDGKTAVGMVRDWTGGFNYPIVYKKAEDGTWSYKIIGAGLVWDAELAKQILPMPVEPTAPDATTYMTQSDKDAYNAAAEDYRDKYDQCSAGLIPWDELPTYPLYWMFLTDRKAEWQADSTKYEEEVAQFWIDYAAYGESLSAATTGYDFQFNDAYISHNGKYFAASIALHTDNDDPEFGGGTLTMPTLTDLTQDSLIVKIFDTMTDHYTTSVTDDGMVIAASPSIEYVRSSYVIKPGETEGINFFDYINERNQNAGIFLKKNYSFDVVYDDGNYDEGGEGGIDDGGDEGGIAWSQRKNNSGITVQDYVTAKDSIVTGTVYCNSDATVFGSFMQEQFTDTINYLPISRSYIIDLNEGATSGIHNAAASEATNAPVLRTEYYNINGQRIGRAPENGVFLEKKITANGAVTVKRVK